jgi:hypothetical protein
MMRSIEALPELARLCLISVFGTAEIVSTLGSLKAAGVARALLATCCLST